MLPTITPRTAELAKRISEFMEAYVYPAEPIFARELDAAADRWDELPVMAELKAKAKAAGLWNLFLPKRHHPDALSNLEYAPLCELMGRFADRLRAVQLLGARHRQHGDAYSLRQ